MYCSFSYKCINSSVFPHAFEYSPSHLQLNFVFAWISNPPAWHYASYQWVFMLYIHNSIYAVISFWSFSVSVCQLIYSHQYVGWYLCWNVTNLFILRLSDLIIAIMICLLWFYTSSGCVASICGLLYLITTTLIIHQIGLIFFTSLFLTDGW